MLLGERFAGIVCSDRWRGYDYLDPTRRQLCWAHLLRDFTAHSEGMGEQQRFGNDGLQIAHELFAAWNAYQHDGDRARLQAQTAPLQASSARCSSTPPARARRTKYHRPFAKNLLNRWPALWTFTHTDGVEPTNNHAERGLRGAVIYRKLSLGSQSDQGERTIERLLSASVTCRLRKQLALRLPHPGHPRQHPRRPHTRAHLTSRGLNAYQFCCRVRRRRPPASRDPALIPPADSQLEPIAAGNTCNRLAGRFDRRSFKRRPSRQGNGAEERNHPCDIRPIRRRRPSSEAGQKQWLAKRARAALMLRRVLQHRARRELDIALGEPSGEVRVLHLQSSRA